MSFNALCFSSWVASLFRFHGLVCVLGLCCGLMGCEPERPKGQTRAPQVPPSASLRADFEQGTFEQSWKGGYQMTALDRIKVVTAPVKAGKGALSVTVKPKDWAAEGSRAELTWRTDAGQGKEGWYRWSIMIPKSYTDTPTLRDEQKRPTWQVMGQWHDTPKPGENNGYSPPLAIRYMLIPPATPANKKDLDAAKQIKSFDPSWRNQHVFFLSYGAPPVTGAFVAIEKGKWYDVLLHVRWSQQDDGFVEMWLNGKPVTAGKLMGKNMYNDLPNYFKLGLYRNPDLTTTNTIYYDNLRFGESRDAVTKP